MLPPRVAVCFTGFVRNHTSFAVDINRLLGDAVYHAFVVAPAEHFELDTAPLVDGEALCRDLKESRFSSCSVNLRPYDPAFFYAATVDRCVVENVGGHYPHRTASMLHGVSQCIGEIREAEGTLGQQYEWILVTRLDFLGGVRLCNASVSQKERGHNTPCNLPGGVSSLWPHLVAERLDIVGARNGWRMEDRLILGKREYMLKLEHAFVNYTSGKVHATGSSNSGIAEIFLSDLLRGRYHAAC